MRRRQQPGNDVRSAAAGTVKRAGEAQEAAYRHNHPRSAERGNDFSYSMPIRSLA